MLFGILVHLHIIVILCCCLIWSILFWILSPCCILYPIRIPPLFCVSPTQRHIILHSQYGATGKDPRGCWSSLVVNVRNFYIMREWLKMGVEVGRPHRLSTAQTVAKRARTPWQHAPYVAETIQQTIKDVNIIKYSFRDILYTWPVAENLS
jgi:hypothetical protein